ncbi:type I-E CRISPR-associated protein Cas6/Cse3/CasE [Candidatus Protochlamydia naegleriophila]|nr:type I-E CRISPR-associated protein Cas6/Cse3/CasE [Candidatus Protochlamydia naegleriophila]
MIRFLIDTVRFYDFAKRRGLLSNSCDDGYAVHSLVSELWGEMAPKPFFVSGGESRYLTVLAYSTSSKSKFIEHAQAFADPSCYEVVKWEHFSEKQMPSDWGNGLVLGFKVRVCPIKRSSKNSSGGEKDAYLAHIEYTKSLGDDSSQSMTRFDVYKEWLKEQLEKNDSVRVEKVGVDAFQFTKFQRRNQKRKVAILERPDVVLKGVLRILDGKSFCSLLERGVGRHRSFGFGMLLLHPIEGG